MADKAPPKGLLSRTGHLLGLGAKLATKEVAQRLKEGLGAAQPELSRLVTQVEQAKILKNSLSRLKGAAMKSGQLLSMELRDLLPPEVIEVLSELQNQSSAMERPTLEGILKAELGSDWSQRLTDFNFQAFAAASIGQVHQAEFNGQKLAVKIQYPGVQESIHNDLRLLKTITQSFLFLSNKKIDTEQMFEEIENILYQEADYQKEASYLEQVYASLPPGKAFRIPKSFPEVSSSKVLSMSFEKGLTAKEFLSGQYSKDLREYFAQLVLDYYSFEFFDLGLVQTDSNFANYLFDIETRELVLLDFGAVKKYTEEFKQNYKELLRLIQKGDDVEMLRHSQKIGFMGTLEDTECFHAYCKMLKKSVEPFSENKQPFAFADSQYSAELRHLTLDFSKKVRFTAPPKDLLFLHRKLGGMFSLLKAMQVQIDLRPYWKKFVE